MEKIIDLLKAISSIAWPIIFLWIIYIFKEPIKKLISSAEQRKFTLKVAGNELSVEEASEQQRKIVVDVQTQVAALEEKVDSLAIGTFNKRKQVEYSQIEKPTPLNNVLWVDDRPRNNSYIVAALEDTGVNVTIATSSREALDKFAPGKFDRIVSDMARPEGEKAGIDLLKIIREHDKSTPYYIYCGGWAAINLKEEAFEAGANGITSSGTALLSMLRSGSKNAQK